MGKVRGTSVSNGMVSCREREPDVCFEGVSAKGPKEPLCVFVDVDKV